MQLKQKKFRGNYPAGKVGARNAYKKAVGKVPGIPLKYGSRGEGPSGIFYVIYKDDEGKTRIEGFLYTSYKRVNRIHGTLEKEDSFNELEKGISKAYNASKEALEEMLEHVKKLN